MLCVTCIRIGFPKMKFGSGFLFRNWPNTIKSCCEKVSWTCEAS